MSLSEPFIPPFYLKNPMVQSFLASFKLRAAGGNPMVRAARRIILETGGGVRLEGAISRVAGRTARGLVIMIHGWEGSIDSTYMLTSGRRFYAAGYHVFRLNLRDHGRTHALNPGLFYATLFEEVFQAVDRAAGLADGIPVFLVGFSLGGNFALRVARRCAAEPVNGLRHIVAVSPVLDPDRATDRIDGHPLLLRYFLKKWTRSLAAKQRLFPDRYDFNRVLRFRSIRQMTDALLADYSDFTDARSYFSAYSVLGDALADNPVPTTIIASADDPVIPVGDFRRLRLSPSTRLVVHGHGGHQGFVEGLSMRCWHERKIVALFDAFTSGCNGRCIGRNPV